MLAYQVDSLCHSAVLHGFYGRQKGSSTGAYASCNIRYTADLGLAEEDSKEAVTSNRQLLLNDLRGSATSMQQWRSLQQAHGIKLLHADDVQSSRIGDALWTSNVTDVLVIQTADCLPVLLYGQHRSLQGSLGPLFVAAIHAGWRGLAQQIGYHVIEQLQQQTHCDKTQLRIGIGPAIGPCCFSIDPQTARLLQESIPSKVRSSCLWPSATAKGSAAPQEKQSLAKDSFYADLFAIQLQQLLHLGIPRAQIDTLRSCTVCHRQAFYSFRRDGAVSGRQASMIALRDLQSHSIA